ncbi:MAG: ATP-binding cassette domain-containing protein [Bacteroidota bacterium]
MSLEIVELKRAQIYQGQQQILADVDLRLIKGEFAYLIGKTGSGKSSLLKTIYGALPLRQGKGEVVNFDLTKLDRKSIPMLRRRLGIVFQDFNLLSDRSVYRNLAFVLKATAWKDKGKIDARINEVLDMVNLSQSGPKMPHQLSGGEQQRIVIARALLNKPDLIIADEPTGNLDPETSDDIMILLRQVAQENNTAVLFATHDYRILEQFPARIIRCIHGRIIDDVEFSV